MNVVTYFRGASESKTDRGVSSSQDGRHHIIEHGYFVHDDDGKIIAQHIVTLSFWDLHRGVKNLSDRKKEAFFYNVILDKKQKDVAKIMGITTVSVGQYVEQAMLQLSEQHFAEELARNAQLEDVGTS
jgi:DNA-directed RNA polymerase specialized sigma24 family protein